MSLVIRYNPNEFNLHFDQSIPHFKEEDQGNRSHMSQKISPPSPLKYQSFNVDSGDDSRNLPLKMNENSGSDTSSENAPNLMKSLDIDVLFSSLMDENNSESSKKVITYYEFFGKSILGHGVVGSVPYLVSANLQMESMKSIGEQENLLLHSICGASILKNFMDTDEYLVLLCSNQFSADLLRNAMYLIFARRA